MRPERPDDQTFVGAENPESEAGILEVLYNPSGAHPDNLREAPWLDLIIPKLGD